MPHDRGSTSIAQRHARSAQHGDKRTDPVGRPDGADNSTPRRPSLRSRSSATCDLASQLLAIAESTIDRASTDPYRRTCPEKSDRARLENRSTSSCLTGRCVKGSSRETSLSTAPSEGRETGNRLLESTQARSLGTPLCPGSDGLDSGPIRGVGTARRTRSGYPAQRAIPPPNSATRRKHQQSSNPLLTTLPGTSIVTVVPRSRTERDLKTSVPVAAPPGFRETVRSQGRP